MVAPQFHGYGRSVVRALRSLGHRAQLLTYDRTRTALGRGLHRASEASARLGFPAGAMGERFVELELRALLDVRKPDLLLATKLDGMSFDAWDLVARRGVKRAVWLYDDLEFMRAPDGWEECVEYFSSYSARDSETLAKYSCVHVPHGFDAEIRYQPRIAHEIVFVGARYENRERTLEDLVRAGVPVRTFGRSWRGAVDPLPTHGELTRGGSYGVFAGAAGSLNLHRTPASGDNCRVFEIPGAGGCAVSDRRLDAYFEPDEYFVFADVEGLADVCRRVLRAPGERRVVAEKARTTVMRRHLYRHRFADLFAAWGLT